MFWKSRQGKAPEPLAARPDPPVARTKQRELEQAAEVLAASLRSYADASYAANHTACDDELKTAHRKVAIARKVVTEGRLGYALGRCLPEHMAHWHAWSQRPDFAKLVGFDADDIISSRTQEEDGLRRIEVSSTDFTFNGSAYRFVFRDFGMSPAPGDHTYYGEVHFHADETCVAKFSVSKDAAREYSEWEFFDVLAFRIGSWMSDALDMAAQIDAFRERSVRKFSDERALRAAAEIDLG